MCVQGKTPTRSPFSISARQMVHSKVSSASSSSEYRLLFCGGGGGGVDDGDGGNGLDCTAPLDGVLVSAADAGDCSSPSSRLSLRDVSTVSDVDATDPSLFGILTSLPAFPSLSFILLIRISSLLARSFSAQNVFVLSTYSILRCCWLLDDGDPINSSLLPSLLNIPNCSACRIHHRVASLRSSSSVMPPPFPSAPLPLPPAAPLPPPLLVLLRRVRQSPPSLNLTPLVLT
mmetsp:Transcript_6528/g.11585  ORF Transcript_6528/g.11585 Transcript_6528/m.11585 type:complete len:231 (-) Transcript_6528:49-741(-)